MDRLNFYDKYRDKMRSGDTILWRGNSLISRAILLFTPISHASLVIRLQEFEGLRDRRFLLEAVSSGVVLRLLSDRLEEYNGKAYWLPLKDEYPDAIREHIAVWALQRVGVAYDYGSVIKNIFGRVSADAKKFFCSEFNYMAYRAARILLKMKAPRPGDIMKFPIFKKPPMRLI